MPDDLDGDLQKTGSLKAVKKPQEPEPEQPPEQPYIDVWDEYGRLISHRDFTDVK